MRRQLEIEGIAIILSKTKSFVGFDTAMLLLRLFFFGRLNS